MPLPLAPDDGHQFPGGYVQVDAPERHHLQVGWLEDLEQIPALDVGLAFRRTVEGCISVESLWRRSKT